MITYVVQSPWNNNDSAIVSAIGGVLVPIRPFLMLGYHLKNTGIIKSYYNYYYINTGLGTYARRFWDQRI